MGIVQEFKEFAIKGNMIDMAVGIIIGGAFGKIVASLVENVFMPPLGLLVGGVDFTNLKFKLADAVGDKPALTWNYGNFLQECFNFIVVAFAVFIFVKAINTMRKKAEAAPAAPPAQEKLLAEIRDLIKAQSAR